MAIVHTFVSAKADSSDATRVNASNWNAAHTNTDPTNETPTGTVDGENNIFTLANSPSPTGSLQLYVNGILQFQSVDYTLSGATVTFLGGRVPVSGALMRAWYRI